jgi:hypothetical protein
LGRHHRCSIGVGGRERDDPGTAADVGRIRKEVGGGCRDEYVSYRTGEFAARQVVTSVGVSGGVGVGVGGFG